MRFDVALTLQVEDVYETHVFSAGWEGEGPHPVQYPRVARRPLPALHLAVTMDCLQCTRTDKYTLGGDHLVDLQLKLASNTDGTLKGR